MTSKAPRTKNSLANMVSISRGGYSNHQPLLIPIRNADNKADGIDTTERDDLRPSILDASTMFRFDRR
jgi:hypothetical protein